jgi:hypothetical protein
LEKYELDIDQIAELLHHAIDLFLRYEYELGYDEPRARAETIQEIVRTLALQTEGPEDSE